MPSTAHVHHQPAALLRPHGQKPCTFLRVKAACPGQSSAGKTHIPSEDMTGLLASVQETITDPGYKIKTEAGNGLHSC